MEWHLVMDLRSNEEERIRQHVQQRQGRPVFNVTRAQIVLGPPLVFGTTHGTRIGQWTAETVEKEGKAGIPETGIAELQFVIVSLASPHLGMVRCIATILIYETHHPYSLCADECHRPRVPHS
jgi:hypothetical protein